MKYDIEMENKTISDPKSVDCIDSKFEVKIEKANDDAKSDAKKEEAISTHSPKLENKIYKVIIPPGYTLEHLRNMIQNTSIKDQCEFVNTVTDINELCDGFIQLFQKPKSLQDMAAIYSAAYMMYMIKPYTFYTTLPCRILLVNRVFQEADTLWPHHIHYLVNKMLTFLKVDDDIDGYFLNLVKGLPWMTVSSETGKMIAIAIARFLIAQKCGKKIKLYSFKGFSELLDMLHMIDLTEFIGCESLSSIYVLVHALGFLLNAVANSSNEYFIQCGYRNMKLTLNESKKLFDWCQKLQVAIEGYSCVDVAVGESEILMHITRFLMHTHFDPNDTRFCKSLF